MKLIKVLSLIFCAALLSGCSHKITLTSFDTGEIVKAWSHPTTKKIWAKMPDGELLKGTFGAVGNGSISTSFGSATAFGGGSSTSVFGSGTTYSSGDTGTVYAILTSTKPGSHLALEIYAHFNPWTTHGFGDARTNDGRSYRVTF